MMLTASQRARYFVGVLFLVAVLFGSEKLLDIIYVPASLEATILAGLIVRIPPLLFALLLLWLWREKLASIGLRRPASWWAAFATGVLLAMGLFTAVWISEQLGYRRDLSFFEVFHGNLTLTLYEIGFVLVAAGFYEEFIYRGVIFYGLATAGGGGRLGWTAAAVAQAGLFGLAHAYQSPIGIIVAGTIGLIAAIVFLSCGRNLWPIIVGHALYDAARLIWYYLHGALS
jgi:uncharacterized protein